MTGLHDAPSAAQLVQAVREWLDRDVVSATTGRLKFHARVASNVLAIVERELELGPEQADAHRARLDALGVADEAELAAQVLINARVPCEVEIRIVHLSRQVGLARHARGGRSLQPVECEAGRHKERRLDVVP